MTQISKYQINSRFTGLRQLPNQYSATVSFGGTTYTNTRVILASTNITIPAGTYVDSVLMKSTYQNQNFVGHYGQYQVSSTSLAPGLVYYTVNRTSSTRYTASVILYVGSGYSLTIPNSTLEVIIRLAISPFN